MFKSARITMYLTFALLSLILIGCTSINIMNESTEEGEVVVWVREPDFYRGKSWRIPQGEVITSLSAYGGKYSVTVIDQLIYSTSLQNIRDIISRSITINQQDPAYVAELQNALEVYNQRIASLHEAGQTCSGTVPDWGSVDVFIRWNAGEGQYQLSCIVENPSN